MDKNIYDLLNKINNANLYTAFIIADSQRKNITEIRIRPNTDISIKIDGSLQKVNGTYQTLESIEKIFLSLCDYTVSAYDEQISDGFITICDGIRVGIGGRFYISENGRNTYSKVTSMNIRIPHKIFFTVPQELLLNDKGFLIIGKPHSGKTTMLKSLCRCFNNKNIAVCDERLELFDDSLNCDFICGVKKSIAIENATRSLSPDIIICDEIAGAEESEKILSAVNSGVKFICTAHCDDINSIYNKPNIDTLLTANVFSKIVLLSNDNNRYIIKEIVDV